MEKLEGPPLQINSDEYELQRGLETTRMIINVDNSQSIQTQSFLDRECINTQLNLSFRSAPIQASNNFLKFEHLIKQEKSQPARPTSPKLLQTPSQPLIQPAPKDFKNIKFENLSVQYPPTQQLRMQPVQEEEKKQTPQIMRSPNNVQNTGGGSSSRQTSIVSNPQGIKASEIQGTPQEIQKNSPQERFFQLFPEVVRAKANSNRVIPAQQLEQDNDVLSLLEEFKDNQNWAEIEEKILQQISKRQKKTEHETPGESKGQKFFINGVFTDDKMMDYEGQALLIEDKLYYLGDLINAIRDRIIAYDQQVPYKKRLNINTVQFLILTSERGENDIKLKTLMVCDKMQQKIQPFDDKRFKYWIYVPKGRSEAWLEHFRGVIIENIKLKQNNSNINRAIKEILGVRNGFIDGIASVPQEDQLLVLQLEEHIRQFGGFKLAFNLKSKTRYLSQVVLFHIIRSQPKLQMDMEFTINFCGRKISDVCIVERDQQSDDIGSYLKCLRAPGIMRYLIEIKKYDQKQHFNNFDEYMLKENEREFENVFKGDDESHLQGFIYQIFDQLRRFCITEQEPQAFGIITNFKYWIFTKYSLVDEAREIILNDGKCDKNPFQMSESFCIVKKDQQTGEESIDTIVLCQVMKIIEFLYAHKC